MQNNPTKYVQLINSGLEFRNTISVTTDINSGFYTLN